METSFARRSFLLVPLALFLGFLVTVAASAELPLLPPLDHVQSSTVDSATSHTPGTQHSRSMSQLIRIPFRDQVRWRPFVQHYEHSPHRTHHRVVRQYRPRPSLPSTESRSKNVNCEMESKPGHGLAAHRFHLRGKPSPSSLVPHLQTIVQVTRRPAPPRPRQHIPVELASH